MRRRTYQRPSLDQYVPSFGWSVEPYYRIGIAKNLEGFHWYTTQYYEVYQMSFKE